MSTTRRRHGMMRTSAVHPIVAAEPPAAQAGRSRASRFWRPAAYAGGLALGGLAIWTVTGKADELSGASHYLAELEVPWVVLALLCELASYMALAAAQRRLLRAGGVRTSFGSMTTITFAGSAIQNTLPAGLVLAAAYTFRQFRRYGADDVLAGWVVLATGVMSFAALAAIAAAGVVLALGPASALDLVGVIAGAVVVALLLVVAWVKRAGWLVHGAGMLRASKRVVRRPRGDPDALVRAGIERLGAVSPGPRNGLVTMALVTANWAADLGCLAFAFLAVGSGVPWHGLLLAYGAGQLAAVLPITPGGLGVVEGSLTVALVAFGGAEASTVAAVLVYRLFNFWAILPVGWGCWGAIKASVSRRARRSAAPPAAPTPALVIADEP